MQTDRPENCLNCGEALQGAHCHGCGQKAVLHRTIASLFHDLLHGVLHFDGKFWRTFPLLAWNPGVLTRRYIDGERSKYVSPIALFLFSAFLAYAAFSYIGHDSHSALSGENIDQVVKELAREEANNSVPIHTKLDVSGPELQMIWQKVKENPSLLAYKVMSNAYKFSWALIPTSTLLLWLLFPFSRRFALFDHAVFVTYSIAFMTIAFSLIALLDTWNVPYLTEAIFFYLPYHFYRHLRGTYELSRAGALIRTLPLIFFAIFNVIMFVVLLITLAAI